ncbi:hypothetical protein VB773_20170 [Haloarculaceae archaeon H-GB2-1]|nr:hypothetical protein [Haloarculaceae archaeon H-GB2-1]
MSSYSGGEVARERLDGRVVGGRGIEEEPSVHGEGTAAVLRGEFVEPAAVAGVRGMVFGLAQQFREECVADRVPAALDGAFAFGEGGREVVDGLDERLVDAGHGRVGERLDERAQGHLVGVGGVVVERLEGVSRVR